MTDDYINGLPDPLSGRAVEREQRRAARKAEETRQMNVWAMRAADHINDVRPYRGAHLGNLADFARAFPDWSGRTWQDAYAYLTSRLSA
jgi:hypothetical protein